MSKKILIGLLFYCAFQSALACTCWHPEPDDYLKSARLAFRGTVVAVGDGTPGSPLPAGAGSVTMRGPQFGKVARFRVQTLFKGKAGTEVEVGYTESDGANCGWGFKEGTEVTVLAGGSEGRYSTSMCMMIPYASYTGRGDSRYSNALGKYREQREGYELALAGPGPKDLVLRAQAAFFEKYNDLAQAEDAFGALLALRPDDASALGGRGRVRYATGQHALALADYDTLLAMDASNADAKRGRTLSLLKLDRMAELGPGDRDFSGFESRDGKQPNFAGLDLWGARFRNARLSQTDFSHSDLRAADYTGAHLYRNNFKGARLSGARFDELKDGYEANFEDADLQGASFKGAALSHARLTGADLRRANFSNANMESASLENAKLGQAKFKGARFVVARLAGTRWKDQDLSGSDLRGADLRNAVLGDVNLAGAKLGIFSPMSGFHPADLRGTDMSTANLARVEWSATLIDCTTKLPNSLNLAELPIIPLWHNGCQGKPPRTGFKGSGESRRTGTLANINAPGSNMGGMLLGGLGITSSDFSGSDFSGADLTRADINRSNFDNVNFTGVNLNEAHIGGVSFKGASFENAKMIRAQISNVDLSQSQLSGADLTGLCYDDKTIWPKDFNPKAAGAREMPGNMWCTSVK